MTGHDSCNTRLAVARRPVQQVRAAIRETLSLKPCPAIQKPLEVLLGLPDVGDVEARVVEPRDVDEAALRRVPLEIHDLDDAVVLVGGESWDVLFHDDGHSRSSLG